jgi:uncharacterized delta-60 repeat protein
MSSTMHTHTSPRSLRAMTMAMTVALSLAACSQAPVAPPVAEDTPQTTAQPGFVGTVTLEVGATGVEAVDVQPAAFVAKAPFSFSPGASQVVTFGGAQYLNQNFLVRNNSGQNYRNLMMVALVEPTNINSTAISAITGGVVANPGALALALQPSHGMTAMGVDVQRAHLQFFDPSEVAAFTSQAGANLGSNYLLSYGYQVRNTANGPTVSGIGPSRLTNKVTVGFKLPASTNPSIRYTITYALFTDESGDSLSQSLADQATNTVAGQNSSSVNITSLPQVRTLLGSAYASPATAHNARTICDIRTAGSVALPLAFLDGVSSKASGTFDTCFGFKGGKTTLVGAEDSEANAVVVQPDGKIVAAGYAEHPVTGDDAMTLVRYLPNGLLDKTFGSGGIVMTAIGSSHSEANSVALQPDGKLVVGGYSKNGSKDLATVARYLPNGQLDPSFGTGGVFAQFLGADDENDIADITIAPDGKIVFVGYGENTEQDDGFLVGRLTSNGALDTSFNGVGYRVDLFGNSDDAEAYSLVLQPDGKIVVGGEGQFMGNDVFTVARYTTTGQLDTSFDGDGVAFTNIRAASEDDSIYDLAMQGDKIIAVGETEDSGTDRYLMAMVRYTSSGALDTSFGTGGIYTGFVGINSADENPLYSVAITADNKIIVGGYAEDDVDNGIFVAKFSENGAPDISFNAPLGYNFTTLETESTLYAIVLQPDGKIVGAGVNHDDDEGFYGFLVARYHP